MFLERNSGKTEYIFFGNNYESVYIPTLYQDHEGQVVAIDF